MGGMTHSLMRKALFENRNDALQKLLNNMPLSFFENQDCIVVGISFNGILLANSLAQAIKAPLAFLFTAPILAPNNPECEIAMATETHDVVISEALVRSFGISLDYIYGEVPCLRCLTKEEIEEAYEENTGHLIVNEFLRMKKEPMAVPAVLCKNHGPFAWGKDAMDAVHNAVVLEEVAKMAYRTETINPKVAPAPQELQDKHYFRKHGANAYYGQ